MVVTMQYRDLTVPHQGSHVASLRSQFMETEAFHLLLTEGLYEGSDSGDGFSQPGDLGQPRQLAVSQAAETARRVKRKTLQDQVGDLVLLLGIVPPSPSHLTDLEHLCAYFVIAPSAS